MLGQRKNSLAPSKMQWALTPTKNPQGVTRLETKRRSRRMTSTLKSSAQPTKPPLKTLGPRKTLSLLAKCNELPQTPNTQTNEQTTSNTQSSDAAMKSKSKRTQDKSNWNGTKWAQCTIASKHIKSNWKHIKQLHPSSNQSIKTWTCAPIPRLFDPPSCWHTYSFCLYYVSGTCICFIVTFRITKKSFHCVCTVELQNIGCNVWNNKWKNQIVGYIIVFVFETALHLVHCLLWKVERALCLISIDVHWCPIGFHWYLLVHIDVSVISIYVSSISGGVQLYYCFLWFSLFSYWFPMVSIDFYWCSEISIVVFSMISGDPNKNNSQKPTPYIVHCTPL